MTNFNIKKRNAGHYTIEVLIDHEFRGEFNTTDATLIDDVNEWLDGGNNFYNYSSSVVLEMDVRDLAGINSIAGVDFTKDIYNLLNL